MAFEDKAVGLFIMLIFIVIAAEFLGGIDPTLSAELNNTAAHPNGPLAITIIGFVIVGLAVGALVAAFRIGKSAIEDAKRRFGEE